MPTNIDLYTIKGTKSGSLTLPDSVFDVSASSQLLAQAVRVYLSNQRQGTRRTQTRGQVTATTAKVWRQKGTGNARHGSRRAPIFVGGGRAHGPTGNENFTLKLTKKMRRRAINAALTGHVTNKSILAIKDLDKLDPKTKSMNQLMKKIIDYPKNKKVLIIIDQTYPNLIKAANNLHGISITQASRLNAYEVLDAPRIIITDSSIDILKSFVTPITPKVKPVSKAQPSKNLPADRQATTKTSKTEKSAPTKKTTTTTKPKSSTKK